MLLECGHAYLAPGDDHMYIERKGKHFYAHIEKSDPVNRHRPSVDVLFHSVATVAGNRAIGVILTGMGADGAKGLLAMREAGAFTVAQDEASCVVWGMPRAAFECGAAEKVLPLQKIGQALLSIVYA
jgi:two-component system chemotaxis response regulator CheB